MDSFINYQNPKIVVYLPQIGVVVEIVVYLPQIGFIYRKLGCCQNWP